MKLNNIQWERLSKEAWMARDRASIYGTTKVGTALLSEDNKIYIGCNIEHKFRSHDIHAEVNAIASMITGGSKKIKAILIVAKRNMFTPCGSCMDWIMQFGEDQTLVGFQNELEGEIRTFTARDLMPYYPK